MKNRFFMAIIILIAFGFLVGCNKAKTEPDVPEKLGEPPISKEKEQLIVMENQIFKIFEPAPMAKVRDKIVVKGLASIWEATVQYEFEDGHFILDKGFVTASEGAPGWGEFEITIELDNAVNGSVRVILYETSAKDGSRLNELIIPVLISSEL